MEYELRRKDGDHRVSIQEEINDDPLARALVESLPMAAVILQEDLHIVALNRVAEKLFGSPHSRILDRKAGTALRCVNAVNSHGGCGSSDNCATCLLRRLAEAARRGSAVARQEVAVEVTDDGRTEQRILLLEATPFRYQDRERALLVLQDVTELHRLRGLVPICAACKRIRTAGENWQRLEVFLEDHSHAEFTHCLCPTCLQDLEEKAMAPLDGMKG